MIRHRRNEFSAETKRFAFERSRGICECHLLARAGIPGYSVQGCGRPVGIGNTWYEHINPDAICGRNDLENCAVLTKTCGRNKSATYDIPTIAHCNRVQDHARGIRTPGYHRLPGGRDDKIKKKINGRVVERY